MATSRISTSSILQGFPKSRSLLAGNASYVPATATGGTEVTSGGYKYHTFTSSGSFIVSGSTLSTEYLAIGAGGGGGGIVGGGGGAGAAADGTYSLPIGTYTVTINAGGAGSIGFSASGTDGGTTVFYNSTLNGGGGGGSHQGGPVGQVGRNGGNGGGGAPANVAPTYAGGTSNQSAISGATIYNNAGGISTPGASPDYRGGGGGGIGATGISGATSGNGGAGLNTWLTWASATSTGVSGYYAGGGGGEYYSGGTISTGGAGGGGSGGYQNSGVGPFQTPTSGTVNTGSGGGAGTNGGGNGNSGIVIVRYAV